MLTSPYAILSDQHCHKWSAFDKVRPDGLSNRLGIILDEMERAADELAAAGGNIMVFAGDLFHVRGSISPEVFNPTYDCIERILKRGITIIAIPGNHDLTGKETTELGNAIQTLGKLDGFTVVTAGDLVAPGLVMIPWCSTVAELRDKIEEIAGTIAKVGQTDLIIHAPVNGVLMGIPDHGFDPAELAGFGFRRVFAGHYHNHKEFAGVYSIGATTHQTWSDIGTRAGFLLVDDETVTFRASRAPQFLEMTGEENPTDVAMMVDGNYVRVRMESITPSFEKELRHDLEEMGAAGIVIQASRAPATARTGATVKTGMSLDASVDAYVKTMEHPREAELSGLCQSILDRARAAAAATE